MTDERRARVKASFQAAVDRPAAERDAFLSAEAAGDAGLYWSWSRGRRLPTGLPRDQSHWITLRLARGGWTGIRNLESGDGGLFEPPAVSPDGTRVAIVVRREGTRQLLMVSADGRSSQTLASLSTFKER